MEKYNKSLIIKTITCHDVYNFGASLQAFALQKYLEKLGHDVEIINYKPDYLTFNIWAIGPRWSKNIFLKLLYFAYVVPKRLLLKKRRRKFDSFTKTKLKLTSKTFRSIDELIKDPPFANIYFAGSDQIWNTILPNGKDPSFYLEFAPIGSIRASYAASFAVPEISPEFAGFVKNKLERLDFISVRESTGLKILQDLGIKKGTVVVDPVFLLDKKEWEELSNSVSNDKYIFIYDQENNKFIKQTALSLKKKYNLKIIAIEALYPFLYADKRITDAGPEDFLGLIKNCEICLTNSYHCLSFSLIFHKNFIVFTRSRMNVNSRMMDLLNYLGLSSRITDSEANITDLGGIEYSIVDDLLNKRKIESVEFIQKVIDKALLNE